jgi:DNA-binding IscR family transcriptional regulator
LIIGVSGRKGGYLLAQAADQITVGQIVEATIGPINIVDCVLSPAHSVKADECECRTVYERINKGIRDVLHGLTLDELAHADGGKGLGRVLGATGVECATGGGEPVDSAVPSREH